MLAKGYNGYDKQARDDRFNPYLPPAMDGRLSVRFDYQENKIRVLDSATKRLWTAMRNVNPWCIQSTGHLLRHARLAGHPCVEKVVFDPLYSNRFLIVLKLNNSYLSVKRPVCNLFYPSIIRCWTR